MVIAVSGRDSIRSVGRYEVPEILGKNTCGSFIRAMKKDFGIRNGISMVIDKHTMPLGGLGSSASTAAGAAFGINRLFGLHLSRNRLVHYASLGEVISAGAPHVDNVAPAIFGGFTVVTHRNPIRIRKISVNAGLDAIIILPGIGKASTKKGKRDIAGECAA